MDRQSERIQAVLGKHRQRSTAAAQRYFEYLKKHTRLPCRVIGIDAFPWEKPFAAGGWDQPEYQRLKQDHPSFADPFDLVELTPPETGSQDVLAVVQRLSDHKTFEVGLSGLACDDFEDANYQMIDDYGEWFKNY